MKKKIIIFLISLFLIEKCTTINLSPIYFINTVKYNNITSLKHQFSKNNKYLIKKVAGRSFSSIFFSPKDNFYLISSANKIVKLDKEGNVIFNFNIEEKEPNNLFGFMDLCYSSHYVISWYGIYDLSNDTPDLEPFSSFLNKNQNMTKKQWINKFNKLYSNSEVVFYGHKKSYNSSQQIYFKQDGKWIVLYTNNFGLDLDGEIIKFNIDNKLYPLKRERLLLLKDVKNGVYSNFLKSKSLHNSENEKGELEESLQYKQLANIETIGFSKIDYMNIPYTYIPGTFGGDVINKLTIRNNHEIIFKTRAMKSAGFTFEKASNYINLFDVPTKYQNLNTLTFLYYDYPTNWNSAGNEGVYVIKTTANKV